MTNAAAGNALARRAAASGIRSAVRVVRYSHAELQARADVINVGRDPVFGAAGRNHAGVDVERNRVVVAAPADAVTRLRGIDAAVDVVARRRVSPIPRACNHRESCGIPIRGGIAIWRNEYPSYKCSLGYTATSTSGSRWVLTAGHGSCLGPYPDGRTWGHGSKPFGTLHEHRDLGEVDVARIHISNSYWLQTGGGYLYNSSNINSPSDVDLAIEYRSTIAAGEVVCYEGWRADGQDRCGVIELASDAQVRGMPRVGGMDVCEGDSGGSIYYMVNDTTFWAYGLVSRSEGFDFCTGSGDSWFSPVPSINAYFDSLTYIAKMRIDTR